MRTAELIAALAAGAGPTSPVPAARRVVLASLLGAAAALVVLVEWLGPRSLGEAVRTGPFWMKAFYTLALALAGLIAVERLGRPGVKLGRAPLIALAAIAAMAVLAGVETARARPRELGDLWLGHTWQSCSLHIVALAAPVYLGVVWALRRLAPTRLALTGAAAGLLAGAAGATVYGLHCDETAALFVLTWYTLGVAACAVLGALLGTRLLRW